MSNFPSLVDAFVAKINGQPREPERLAGVPQFLRAETSDGASDILEDWTDWRIVKRDNSAATDEALMRPISLPR